MAGTWTFRIRTWERPGYIALEGSGSFERETAEFFLVVGSQHISLDEAPVNATWSFPPTRREGLLRELEGLLRGESVGASRSGSESEG